jgi:hypothetical protein
MRLGRFLVLALLASALAGGCKRDLGECNLDGMTPEGTPIDGPAALDIAYRITDGLPMYEGQALVQATCGDGAFCHSSAATGASRVGAPAGLNFDVGLACIDGTNDASCTQPLPSCEDGQPETPYCQRLDRLRGDQSTIRSWAEGMIQEMRLGAMPPGEAGRRVQNTTPWLRQSDGSELPSIESGEGEEIVRNWLACQAPVIARTQTPPSEDQQLEPCPSVDGETCVYGGPAGELPEPRWSEIYWSVIFPSCVVCHGPANDNVDANPDNPLGGEIPGGANALALTVLDLTGSDPADTTNWPAQSWSAIVNVSASTAGPCAGQGILVVPNDSADSIMIEKMRGQQTCGDQMPLTGLLAQPLVDIVAEWVDLGAPND